MARRDYVEFKVRIQAPLHEAVKAEAAKNSRSMNAEVVALVERALLAKSLEQVVARAIAVALPSDAGLDYGAALAGGNLYYESLVPSGAPYSSGTIDARPGARCKNA